jgi:hypothetical protein
MVLWVCARHEQTQRESKSFARAVVLSRAIARVIVSQLGELVTHESHRSVALLDAIFSLVCALCDSCDRHATTSTAADHMRMRWRHV